MFQALADFFDSSDFMPHGHCFLWQPDILWLHVISDAGIVAAYYSIPFALLYFVWKRKDLPFQSIFLLFGAFILLCGTTHLMAIWVLWHPDYALEGVIKGLTALVSIPTFFITIKLIPQALLLPSPSQLAVLNKELHDANRKLEILYEQSLASGHARIRGIIDNALDAVIAMDQNGRITEWNRQAEIIFGWAHHEAIGNRLVEMVIPPEPHAASWKKVKNFLTTGSGPMLNKRIELSALNRQGRVFPVELAVTAQKIQDANQFTAFVRDISDRKEAEAHRKRYMEELEHSNQQLDDFAYIASHDLKEPLRGLFNHASFLVEDYKDKLGEDGMKRLNRLTYLSQRMETLVNDLLYFSRLGRTSLAIQEADPNAMINEIAQMMEMFLKEHYARIIVPKSLPRITCDRPRTTEVFRNLITNAIKYNDKKERIVEVGFLESATAPHGPEENVFYVKDNGIGIEPGFYEEIFRMFKRLQSPETEKETGTGAGLTFVKKIVERHNGHIWLESQPGKGTTFYFTLR